MSDKRQLIDDLRAAGDRVSAALESVAADDLERGRYENGWNGRRILAHMASIEWTYPRLLDVARQAQSPVVAGTPTHSHSADQPAAPRPAASGNPVDGYNARQVDKRAGASVMDLADEFRANRTALIDAVASAEDTLLDVHITSAGGARGPLDGVLRFVAIEHVLGHLSDITGGDAT